MGWRQNNWVEVTYTHTLTLGIDEDVALGHDDLVLERAGVAEIRRLRVEFVKQKLSLDGLNLLRCSFFIIVGGGGWG